MSKQVLRMCIVCRQMKDKKELFRVNKTNEGEIFLDTTGKQNGRGAYICKDGDCKNLIKKQKSINRAYKTNIDEKIYDEICAGIKDE